MFHITLQHNSSQVSNSNDISNHTTKLQNHPTQAHFIAITTSLYANINSSSPRNHQMHNWFWTHHSIGTACEKWRENMFQHASSLCRLTWRQVPPAPVERNWRHGVRVASQLGELLMGGDVPYPHGFVARACEEQEGGRQPLHNMNRNTVQ